VLGPDPLVTADGDQISSRDGWYPVRVEDAERAFRDKYVPTWIVSVRATANALPSPRALSST
jgi:hypothetical protein